MGTRCAKGRGGGTAGAALAPTRGGQYRPRRPRASPLWQCAKRHAKELHAAGPSRRALESRVIERFIECGDPHYGFARVYCDACGHDYLLAYSCKTRTFCPSCHQKRVLLYGEWVEANVLAPVAHRQYVFTVPKLLRPAFGRQRAWLGELCRIAARLLLEAYAEAAPGARPGLILFVQSFGDLANFNPHVHGLAADGAFLPDGRFVPLPAAPEALLTEGFRRAVLAFLVRPARAVRRVAQPHARLTPGGKTGPLPPVLAGSPRTTRCESRRRMPRVERSSPALCCAPRCPWRR